MGEQKIMESKSDRHLTVKEGAYYADCEESWLYKRIGQPGGPPYKRRGRKIVFPRDEFLEWAKQTVIP